jgi:hypothetical protein
MKRNQTHCNRTVIALLILTSSLAHAQDAAPSDRETIQQLVQQVKELQDKVKVLESQQGSSANSSQSATSQPVTAPPSAQEEASNTERESLAQELHKLHGIQWRGFGEVDYKVLNQRTPELGTYGFVPGSHGNFYTGDFDLLLTARINDKASVLSEMVFGEEDAQKFGVDLERMLLKYDYNDHLKMSFGRYHTGIGYYNFHSGSWLQTMADRPLIVEFANDGGPLPTQAVGVSVTGEIPSGKLGLNYIAEYGSSDTVRPDLNGVAVDDENNGNHVTFGLFVRPGSIPGLQVGGSIYHDRISDTTRGPSTRLGQTIANVHLVYIGHTIEFLNEGFLIRHDYEPRPIVYNVPAFYSQVSKQFGRFRPFFRYQYINAHPRGLLEDIALRHGPSFGTRYDFNDNVAFKTQLDHTLRKDQPDLNGLHLQLAFTF